MKRYFGDEDVREMGKTYKRYLMLFVVMLPFMIIFSVVTIYHLHRSVRQTIIVDRAMSVDTVVVEESYNAGRGVYLSPDSLVQAYAELVGEVQCRDLWQSHEPKKLTKRTKAYKYKLGDLGFPYELWKEADSDTINVRKEGYEFQFILMDYNSKRSESASDHELLNAFMERIYPALLVIRYRFF